MDVQQVEETSLQVRFSGGTVGDCLEAVVDIEVTTWAGHPATEAEPTRGLPVHTPMVTCPPWGVMAPHTEVNDTCTVTNLMPDTLYNVRMRILCPMQTVVQVTTIICI